MQNHFIVNISSIGWIGVNYMCALSGVRYACISNYDKFFWVRPEMVSAILGHDKWQMVLEPTK